MKSGRKHIFNTNTAITFLMLSAFSCNVFAQNTELSQAENILASDKPSLEIINSFFAPIDAPIPEEDLNTIPQIPTEQKEESVFKPVKETVENTVSATNQQSAPSPQINFEDLNSQMEDNPFMALSNITLPSEYKSQTKKNIPQNNSKTDTAVSQEDTSYSTSAVRENFNQTIIETKENPIKNPNKG